MGKKVSDFDPAGTLDGTELVGIIKDGVKKTTIQDIIDLGGGFTLEEAATYAAVSASTAKRLVWVDADENNNGDKSLYIHNGIILKFLLTIA